MIRNPHDPPAYQRIAAALLEVIDADPPLAPGSRLPSVRALAEEHRVTANTAHAAVAILRDQGRVLTDPTGIYVAWRRSVSSPAERITRIYDNGMLLRRGETQRMISAGTGREPTPEVLARFPDADPAELVHRRYVVCDARAVPTHHGISWFSPQIAAQVPELSVPESLLRGCLVSIRDATGLVVHDMPIEVWCQARPAAEDLEGLALPPDTACVMRTLTTCLDERGTVLEFNIAAHPADFVLAVH